MRPSYGKWPTLCAAAWTRPWTNTLPRPASKALERFHPCAQGSYGRIDELENESRTLAALRDTLLPKLISGQLRISRGERLSAEANESSLPTLRIRVQEAERERKLIEKELAAIPVKAGDEKTKAHQVAAECVVCAVPCVVPALIV
jgi:hypothetical protein